MVHTKAAAIKTSMLSLIEPVPNSDGSTEDMHFRIVPPPSVEPEELAPVVPKTGEDNLVQSEPEPTAEDARESEPVTEEDRRAQEHGLERSGHDASNPLYCGSTGSLTIWCSRSGYMVYGRGYDGVDVPKSDFFSDLGMAVQYAQSLKPSWET